MKLKATFTYFISKEGLQVYRILRSISYCHQNIDILVPVFVFQKEALLKHTFLHNVHSPPTDISGTQQ